MEYLRNRRSNLTSIWSLLELIASHTQQYPLWLSRLCQTIPFFDNRLLFITLFLLIFLLLIVSNYLHIPSLYFTLQVGCPQWQGAQGEGGGGEGGGAGVGGEGTLPTTTTINGRWQWQHTTIKQYTGEGGGRWYEWTNERPNKRMNERTNGWTNEWMNKTTQQPTRRWRRMMKDDDNDDDNNRTRMRTRTRTIRGQGWGRGRGLG